MLRKPEARGKCSWGWCPSLSKGQTLTCLSALLCSYCSYLHSVLLPASVMGSLFLVVMLWNESGGSAAPSTSTDSCYRQLCHSSPVPSRKQYKFSVFLCPCGTPQHHNAESWASSRPELWCSAKNFTFLGFCSFWSSKLEFIKFILSKKFWFSPFYMGYTNSLYFPGASLVIGNHTPKRLFDLSLWLSEMEMSVSLSNTLFHYSYYLQSFPEAQSSLLQLSLSFQCY